MINGYTTDRHDLAVSISDCLVACQKLGLQTEEVLRQGNNELRRETEIKMCNFTDNMLKEFRYINKRVEDKILYEVGVYREMPEDERAPPKRLPLKIYSDDINLQKRPASAHIIKPDFES